MGVECGDSEETSDFAKNTTLCFSDDRTMSLVSTGYQFGQCVVSQMGATFAYDQEYLGPAQRLVFTPLTERAYLSLTMAMRAFHCGALIGPPDTGKSETVKDLAKVRCWLCFEESIRMYNIEVRAA